MITADRRLSVWNCHVCSQDDPCTLLCSVAIVNPKLCPFKLTEEKAPVWECVGE